MLLLGAAAAVLGGFSGCGWSAQKDGMDVLTVSDLAAPAQPNHFTGGRRAVTATVRAQTNGCVTVTVDGVTRMPLWPSGTTAKDDGSPPGTYTLTIPGGPDLRATMDGGDGFSAVGVVDDGGPRFAPEGEPDDGKIASMLGFCGIDAAPIAFFDARSIKPFPSP